MKFEYTITDKGHYIIIRFNGNLIEKSQAAGLLDEVEEHIIGSKNHFIVDLSGLSYLNSSGLNTLISILTKARNAGGDAVMACVPKKIKNLLLITKLNTVFFVANTLKEAIEQINGELAKPVCH